MVFRKLFSPCRIGETVLRNRLVMSVISLKRARDSFVTPEMVSYYALRARGGVGLVIVGAAYLDEGLGKYDTAYLCLGDDKYLPGLKTLTQAVQAEGAKIAVHLLHPGKFALSRVTGTTPVSPSPLPSRFTGETPRELTGDEIKAIQAKFVEDIARAQKAGFDAVELNCCSGYLIREFLSPLTNQRQDLYGGSPENRRRFLLEIVASVKRELGPTPALICKITADEFLPGGMRLPEAQALAVALEEAGVDALSVTVGGHETLVPMMPGRVPEGTFVYYAQAIKEKVKIPVMAGVRIRNPYLAENILEEERADLIALGRPLHADPWWPQKVAQGRQEEIIPCISCNQGCFDRVFGEDPVTCLVNPGLGEEVLPASLKKKVFVVGGGPAGIQTALTAAARGHAVVLYEKGKRLGGQLNFACLVPGKEEFKSLLAFWERELGRYRVKVCLGKEGNVQAVRQENPDVVIVATGSVPSVPFIPGAGEEQGKVFATASEVLTGKVIPGKEVVILGGGGTGCDVALFLSAETSLSIPACWFLLTYRRAKGEELVQAQASRRRITVVEMLPRVGASIGRSTRWSILQELTQRGVTLLTQARATKVTSAGVLVTFADGREEELKADTVIFALGNLSRRELAAELEAQGFSTYIVGDAARPGNLLDALHSAYYLAREL